MYFKKKSFTNEEKEDSIIQDLMTERDEYKAMYEREKKINSKLRKKLTKFETKSSTHQESIGFLESNFDTGDL